MTAGALRERFVTGHVEEHQEQLEALLPAVGTPADDTPRGYASRVLRWTQDNGPDRDDNRTMTDNTNGEKNAFGSLGINFGGGDANGATNGATPAPSPSTGASLNPFGGGIAIINDAPGEACGAPGRRARGATGDGEGRTESKVLIIGSGPAGPDRRHLRGARQPRADRPRRAPRPAAS